jgi:SagB-type dehydrogenase family enzyme
MDHIRRIAALALTATFCLGGSGVALDQAAERRAVALPEPRQEGKVSVEQALARRRSIREYASEPLPLAAVSQLLWAAQGVTDPGGLRTAPSAGALHPLEVYLVAGAVAGLEPGIYRYDPERHRLLFHAPGDPREDLAEAALAQDWVARAPAQLVLAAVPARTARKYGRRAPRYVHMEVGHAAQNVYLQAVALDLGTVVVGAFHDERLKRVLALPKEVEPLALMPLGRPR